MANVVTFLIVGAWLAVLVVVPVAAGYVEARRDRRRILADGLTADATVTAISAPGRNGACTVSFAFTPPGRRGEVVVSQDTDATAIDATALAVGQTIQVHYLPKWPRWAFVDALTIAARQRPAPAGNPAATDPAVYFVAYVDPAMSPLGRGRPANTYRWIGSGDVAISSAGARFVARRRRPFWFPATVTLDVPFNVIANVEVFANAVSLEVVEPDQKVGRIRFWAVNPAQAAEIGSRLPGTKTEAFSPQMAEAAGFMARLKELAPATPVTVALVVINILVFALAAAAGAGVLTPDPEAMVRLGTDYSPLTRGGQWWRLLTSTFLHFGIAHVAFNMWALIVNGPLAERIYGSARYLMIYLAAGLAGSIASLWWHTVVNGAGASGAIFGVFGALLAFFLQKKDGVPASVIARYRNTLAIFIAYNLLNGLAHRGIDNAAHVGGLASGFVLGFVLARPLEGERSSPAREHAWAAATALLVCLATALSCYRSPRTEALLARVASDGARNATAPASRRSDAVAHGPPAPTRSPAEIASCRATCAPQFGSAALQCLQACGAPTQDGDAAPSDVVASTAPAALDAAARISSFWGVRLGETRAEIERSKGSPLKIEGVSWLYNARGPGDNGLIELIFNRPGTAPDDPVMAVFYQGDYASAPPELTFIIGVTGEGLVEQFRPPVWTAVPNNDEELEMFGDGLTARLWHRQTVAYGIQSYYRLATR